MLHERPLQDETIAEFLAARRISNDFPTPRGKIRVETRIRISRPPWVLRTVALRDGKEWRREPFAPAEEQEDPGAAPSAEALQSFASKALDLHYQFCRRVEEDLAAGGAGFRSRAEMTIDLDRLPPKWVAGIVAALILAVVLGVFLLRREPVPAVRRPTAPPKVKVAEATAPAEEGPESGTPGEAEQEPGDEAAPAAADPGPPVEPRTTPPPVAISAAPSPPSAPATVQPTADSPSLGSASEPVETEEPAPLPEQSVISDIEPTRYREARLQAGQIAYVDTDATFAQIPPGYENLRCIRTADSHGAVDQTLSFHLNQGARVYVLHDRRIRNKPRWLRSFAATGEHVTLNRPLGTGPVYLDLFVQEQPAGPITLGPNIEWSAFTKRIREAIPKDLCMYLVCVEPR